MAAFDYVLMLFALGADVRAVVTNNAGRAEQLFALAGGCAAALIRDLEHGEISARAGLDDDTRRRLQASRPRAATWCRSRGDRPL